MGGDNINKDILIDKSIHKAINSRSAVLKVKIIQLPNSFIGIIIVILSQGSIISQHQHFTVFSCIFDMLWLKR